MKDFVGFIHCSVPGSWNSAWPILEILWIFIKEMNLNSEVLSVPLSELPSPPYPHLPLLLSSGPYHFFLGLLFNFPSQLYTPSIIAFNFHPPTLARSGISFLHSTTSKRREGLRSPLQTLSSVSFCCSVTRSCPTLCQPVDCKTPDFPVLYHLLELAQTHVHSVGDAIQPSHSLSSPSPPAFNLSKHQGLFIWVSSSHPVTKVLELQHQSFQWIFRTNFL